MIHDREMKIHVELTSGNCYDQTYMDASDDNMTRSWLTFFNRVYGDMIVTMKVYENKADGKGWTVVPTSPGLSANGYQLPTGSYQSVYGDMYTGVPAEPVDPRYCNHSPKLYTGFMESYNYCTKCDKKLENV